MIETRTGDVIYAFLKKQRITLSVVLIILSAVFLFLKADIEFQKDSETLVVDPILMDLNDVKAEIGAFGLGYIDDDDEDYPYPTYTEFLKPGSYINDYYRYQKYSSQTGLQGYVFRGIAHVIRTTAIIGILRFLCCLVLVLVLYYICINLKRHYGFIFPVSFWIIALISPYFINFAPNLYWVEFTWILPMLLGLLCLTHPEKRKWIYLMFFLAVLAKCMCGYEYISTIMMSGIAFQTAEWISGKQSRKNLFKCIVASGFSMLAGFVAAVVIHIFLLSKEICNGDISESFSYFVSRIVNKRTFGDVSGFDERLKNSLEASVGDVLKIYFWDSAYSRLLLGLILFAIVVLFADRLIFKKDHRVHITLILIQLAAVLSWLILAKSHSFDHRHISFVLFDLGLTQTCLCCILKAFSDHICLGIKKDMKQDKASYSIIFRLVK